jgi:radical SAM protein with 4Fe4S-binding SPASM domain
MNIKTLLFRFPYFQKLFQKRLVKTVFFWKKMKRIYDQNHPTVSPTVCAVPWMHLNFEPDGRVVPCCLASADNYESGNINTQKLEDIWNSPNQRALRKQMMQGIEPKICHKCFDRERVSGESGRVFHNQEFKEVLDAIPNITLEDGTCTTMELKYWDFRFSNLCNYKCRSCGPRYSSAWVPDGKKLGWKIELEKVSNIENVQGQRNYDFLNDQIVHAKKIYFAGGEPLLMPEHWQTLDILVEQNRFDVKLNYNTNCSVLSYGKKNVLDYWRRWQPGKIEVWPSIDEIGPRAELIRSGTVWHKVEENLKEIVAVDNITIRPGLTIGAWNVNRLPEIISHLIELGVISRKHHYLNFFINLLEVPEHYHVSILNDQFRQETIAKINAFIVEYDKKYNTHSAPKFSQILYELSKPQNDRAVKNFYKITDQIDQVRNENIFEVIPELKTAI